MATITKPHLEEHIVRIREYLAESQEFCRSRGFPVKSTFNVASICMSLRNNNYGLAKRIATELLVRGYTVKDEKTGMYSWTADG